MSSFRPQIAIVGRFAATTSALRFGAVVNARALLESVWAAGGDPVTLLPVAGADWRERLEPYDGVLLPGGGDIDPAAYGGGDPHESLYGVDAVQDAVDLDLAGVALATGIPLLAICRGLHVVNVARGGSLVQDLPVHHRHHEHDVLFGRAHERFGFAGPRVRASCFHHQAIDRIGDGITVVARASDGVPEAVLVEAPGWAVGVQWHPEDTAATDPDQAALFGELVRQAESWSRPSRR